MLFEELPFTGDTNRDGVVNLVDFSFLSSAYGRRSTNANWTDIISGTLTAADADFNFDGAVNLSDFSLLSTGYGKRDDLP